VLYRHDLYTQENGPYTSGIFLVVEGLQNPRSEAPQNPPYRGWGLYSVRARLGPERTLVVPFFIVPNPAPTSSRS